MKDLQTQCQFLPGDDRLRLPRPGSRRLRAA